MSVLFVQYPTCSTCRRARAWLDAQGVEYAERNIAQQPPTAGELTQWVELSGLPLRKFFNTSGKRYRELGVKARLDAGMDEKETLELLASDGMLVKRPIVVRDGQVLVGFKQEQWEQTLL